ncbi:hypothetical protein P9273_32135, partial [Mesorhizobium sp. WSM4935]|uniref:hypothetical protein n=1 Tax=Mesorhizobium sp. WSM4935 TaxID=3038547 RepID=UPI00241591C9
CHGFVAFDRVYLVQHGEWAKVGIAFGSRRVRLHLSRGYVLVFESEPLSPGVPRMIEQAVLGMLREEGVPQAPYGVVPEDGITETF